MSTLSYKKLNVWQRSIELCREIYLLSQSLPKAEEFNLKAQMRRAAISVSSNIAGGSARKGSADQVRFYTIARSSLVELDSQIETGIVLGFFKTSDHDKIAPALVEVYKMLSAMLNPKSK